MILTDQDLFSDDLNFVYGEATPLYKIGIASFYRVMPEFTGETFESEEEMESKVLLRFVGTTAHELGHLLNFEHCVYYKCLMNGQNNLKESDATPLHLCPVCYKKLYHLLNFNEW